LDKFEEYLLKIYLRKTARDRLNHARRYAHCLFDGNFSELKVLSDDKRGRVLSALNALAMRALITFLGYALLMQYQ
jgi:hypothetical protein